MRVTDDGPSTKTTADRASRGARHRSAWDRAFFDEWVRRLGAERMRGVLVKLADQLRTLAALVAADGAVDREDLNRRAHDAASTAGMLGFGEVTRCCRALSEAGLSLQDARPSLAAALQSAIKDLEDYLSAQPSKAAA